MWSLRARSSFTVSSADCKIQQAASASRRCARFFRVISAATIARSTTRVDRRSSWSVIGISLNFKNSWAKSRTESQRGPALPSILIGQPRTNPPTDSELIISKIVLTSGVNLTR